ncbi:MAG: MFS transporter [Hyphomicrobiales bacterium]|nr:MFS transporter [Hyphomicrobiales bacterium]MDE2115281.1 MFS transporter [Hyphomicrobiales bacterium]
MTTTAASVNEDHRARANVWRLAAAMALAGANSTVIFATGAIIGVQLAPVRGLATLPISCYVVGMAISTLPAGVIARRFGRRPVFMIGTSAGVLCGILAAYAVIHQIFWLFCMATFFGGIYGAVVQSYRFAAADGVAHSLRARAISLVMAGGVIHGLLGPELVTLTMNLWRPYLFAASFVVQAVVALIALAVVSTIDIPKPPASHTDGARPLFEIVRQLNFIVAALCGVVSYALMNLVMTSAPLAMKMCGFAPQDSNFVIQWHVVAMYLPSFLTGAIISRFGARKVVGAGLLMIASAAVLGLSGITLTHFVLGLTLLGLGWNFGFIGASAMVVETHTAAERAKVQAFNDFLIFSTMAIGSFSSGQLLAFFGWASVNWVVFPPVLVALLLLLFNRLRRRHLAAA